MTPTPKKNQYFYAVGKRKTSVATIRIYPTKGAITINDLPVNEYLKHAIDAEAITEPLNLTNTLGKYQITIRVKGGGHNSQVGAIKLGLSRALLKIDPQFRKTFKSKGLLTRDPRVKERKKPGLKRARKAPQWSKR